MYADYLRGPRPTAIKLSDSKKTNSVLKTVPLLFSNCFICSHHGKWYYIMAELNRNNSIVIDSLLIAFNMLQLIQMREELVNDLFKR